MSTENEVASAAVEELVKISLEGTEVALRLTGAAGWKIGGKMVSVALGMEKTRGAIRMKKLLKSGRPLTVFSIRYKDLEKFQKAAKSYGILYTVITDKQIMDGIKKPDPNSVVDICVPQDIARNAVSCLDHIGVNVIGETKVEQVNSEETKEKETSDKKEKTPEEEVAAAFETEEEVSSPEGLWTGEQEQSSTQSEDSLESSTQSENTTAEKPETATKTRQPYTVEGAVAELFKNESVKEGESEKLYTGNQQSSTSSNEKASHQSENNKSNRILERAHKQYQTYNQFNDFTQRKYTSEEEARLEGELIRRNSHTQEERDALEGRLARLRGESTEKPSVRKELDNIVREQQHSRQDKEKPDLNKLVKEIVDELDKTEKNSRLKQEVL